MRKDKIIPLSRIRSKSRFSAADTVAQRRNVFGDKKNLKLLEDCAIEWNNLDQVRRERERALRYSYGDQWGDLVQYKGQTMTEREYVMKQGNIALSNRLVRRIVNAVVGTKVKAKTEPMCMSRDPEKQLEGQMMSLALQCNWQTNKMSTILTTQFEDFLHGGIAVSRETFEFRGDIRDTWTDICNPNYIFFSSHMKDPRHWDITMIGEIHDITFNELCTKFGENKDDYSKLKEIYAPQNMPHYGSQEYEKTNDKNKLNRIDFYTPREPNMCRVYEIWTQEMKPRYRCHDWLTAELYKVDESEYDNIVVENKQRLEQGIRNGIPMEDIPLIETKYFFDTYWFYQFLAPDGTILREGETPFAHGSHPYSLKLYPFVNGQIHSFIGDIIDQQRYINRLVTLNDFVIRSAAKGALLVPSTAVPDNMTVEEFAEQWEAFDGLILFQPKPGVPGPQQIANKAANIGLTEMINLQLNLMEDISGVHGAMQGKQPTAGTAASLYAQQTANASTMILPVIQNFDDYVLDLATKKAKNIQQFYDEPRMINISGKSYKGVKSYDPSKARDLEYDLSIIESAATPVNRMIINDDLKQFWQSGAISLEMLLECGDFPYSDTLLQAIKTQRELVEKQQEEMQQIPTEVVQQVRDHGIGNTEQIQQLLRSA